MRVHRLRLVNFRQHAETDLRFGNGLTGIVGPNGSGKTTLLEALAWAIYGSKAARGNVASLRRRNAPPRSRVEVELEFTLGAHRYRVSRSLHGAELYQDGEPAPLANSGTAVTERLTRILGMTREEFFSTYFTGQKELAILGAMTAGERARFLSRVLGYERLRDAQVRLKEERSTLRTRLQEIEARMVSPVVLAEDEARAAEHLARAAAAAAEAQSAVAAASQALAEARPAWEAQQALRERVQSLGSDLRVAEQRVMDARTRHLALDRDLAEAVSARQRVMELTPDLEPRAALVEELGRLDEQAARANLWRERTGQLGEVRTGLAAVDARLTALPSPEGLARQRALLAEGRARLAAADEDLDREQAAWVRDQQDARTQVQQLTDLYQELKAQADRLKAAGAEGSCPTCGRPLGASFAEVLDDLERQLAEVTQNGKFYRARIRQLEKEPKGLRTASQARESAAGEVARLTEEVGRLEGLEQTRESLERERTAMAARLEQLTAELAEGVVSYDEARHAAVRQRIQALEPLRHEVERLGGIADRAERLTGEATAAEAELSAREAAVTALQAALVEAGWSEAAFTVAKEAVEAHERAREAAERRLVEAGAEARVARVRQEEIAKRRAERQQGEAEVAALGLELLLNQELDRAFSDLRDDLNATMRPDLSELGSRFLRDLTASRYSDLELDEDYVPVVIEEGEAQQVLSGGEEDVVSLSLRLAISQLIAERAGQPLSLLVLDEIFGSLDEERRQAVLDLLRRLADRFPQVILITHIEAVREGFDHLIRLDFDLELGVARARAVEDDGGSGGGRGGQDAAA